MNNMTLETDLLLTDSEELTSEQDTETVETIGATEGKTDNSDTNPFVVTVVGLAVVFLGLVLLIGIVKLIGTICNAAFGGKKKEKAPSLPPVRREGKKVASSALTEAQRGELVAAISAAIAENMDKPVSGIRIRSIRKVG